MTSTANSTDTAATVKAPETSAALRSCAQPGCKVKLTDRNQSGFCLKHRPHTKICGAVAPKTNGVDHHPPRANGSNGANGTQHAAADRVKILLEAIPVEDKVRMLEAIPLEDKVRMCTQWLAGN